MKEKPTADEFLAIEKNFQILCRNVLGSGKGKEMLEHLERVYCEGKLYQADDRETVYCVAQRDLIMELKHNSKGELV